MMQLLLWVKLADPYLGLLVLEGVYDVFVIMYDAVETKYGLSSLEQRILTMLNGISTDTNNAVIVAGITIGSCPGFNTAGNNDVFVRKFDAGVCIYVC